MTHGTMNIKYKNTLYLAVFTKLL